MQAGYERTDENDDEGIVVKSLDAPYAMGEPVKGQASWIKWKREYERFEGDVDALVVGGAYGSGVRSCILGQQAAGARRWLLVQTSCQFATACKQC